jgi:Methylase involved in ubiquinone/menaquinone biosynthesis
VNQDVSTNPDFCCNAEEIPLKEGSIDGFLLCEVLEHLESPEEVLREAFRLLRKGGQGWITMPFLYQLHADPHDFQRWTDEKIRQVLTDVGFLVNEVQPMGGVGAVVYDLWYATLCRSPNQGNFWSKVGFRIHRHSSGLFNRLDKYLAHTRPFMTTGWAIRLEKPLAK